MKKEKFLTVLFFVLPLLVVLIASAPAGVMVFDGENTAYYSWLQPVSKSSVGWCAPVAALMNYGLFALALVYGLKKKEWCITWIRNVAAIAGCIAVLPNLVRADVMVIPNVFGAIVLFADAIAAHILMKTNDNSQKTAPSGKTLERR